MMPECEIMKAAVIDLAYDELPENEAEQLRMHAADCTECRNMIEQILLTRKMAAQLPAIDPGNAIDVAILEIARTATHRGSKQDTHKTNIQNEPILSAQSSIEKAPTFLDRFRAFLLAPALVTASIAAIVFVTSFFLIEKGTPQNKRFEIEGLPSPSAAQSITPIAKSQPSKPTLVTTKDAEKPSWKPSSSDYNKGLSTDTNPSKTPLNSNGNLGTTGPSHLTSEKRNTLANTKSSFKKERRTVSTFSDEPLDGFDLGDSPTPAAQQQSPPLSVQEIDSLSSKQLQQKSNTSLYSDLQNGLEAYRRGDCKVATSHFNNTLNHSSTTPPQAAIAIHHLGRCEKRRGRCAKAIPWYEQLIRKHKTYPQRATALWETANCQRRLGHNDHARQIFMELAQIPGWESKAQQELENLAPNSESRQ